MRYIRTFSAVLLAAIILAPAAALGQSPPLGSAEHAHAETRADSSVLVGVEANYPPFVFADETGEMRGLSIDYLGLLGKKIGIEFVFSEPSALSLLLERVRANDGIELVTSLTRTEERETFLDFTDSYVSVPAVMVAPIGSDWLGKTFDEAAADGAVVVVGEGYGVQSFLGQSYPESPLLLVSDDTEAMRSVLSGYADVAVIDVASASWILRKEKYLSLGIGPEVGFAYDLSFAVPRGRDQALLSALNQAVAALTDEERSEIESTWFAGTFGGAAIPGYVDPRLFRWVTIGEVAVLAAVLLAFLWNSYLRRRVRAATESMRELQQSLERNVEERTRALDSARAELSEQNVVLEQRLYEQEKGQLAILNVLEDVDEERKKVEELTNRLSLAITSTHIGVWEWDPVTGALVWDEVMRDLFGYGPGAFRGQFVEWESRLHPEDRTRALESVRAAVAGRLEIDVRYRIVLPNKVVRTVRSYGRVRNAAGSETTPQYVGVCLDITKEAIVDQQKTEFVSLASHQLKTPIGAISWDLEMLIAGDYGKVTPKQKDVLQEMYVMSRRVNELINGLLNVSRLELGVFIIEPVMTDVGELLKEVLVEMNPRVQAKQHTLSVQVPKTLSKVSVDPKLMRIVFQNYLSNAVKYTPDHGRIAVKLSYDAAKGLSFVVSNNGEPIPVNEHGRIFDKMYRASNAQKQDPDGNGLGLYLVKKIVEEGGGQVGFTSREGEDTTFFVVVPPGGMKAHAGTKSLN